MRRESSKPIRCSLRFCKRRSSFNGIPAYASNILVLLMYDYMHNQCKAISVVPGRSREKRHQQRDFELTVVRRCPALAIPVRRSVWPASRTLWGSSGPFAQQVRARCWQLLSAAVDVVQREAALHATACRRLPNEPVPRESHVNVSAEEAVMQPREDGSSDPARRPLYHGEVV
jgi:hypothetical protein